MSDDRISACAAWERFSGMAGKLPIPGPATENIRALAAAQLLQAEATVFIVTGQGQKKSLLNHAIPAEFWDMSFELEDWRQGRFIGVKRAIGWEIRCEALGVTFDPVGMEKIAPNARKARHTANAESMCEQWLLKKFAADPQKMKSKPALRDEAIGSVEGLSGAAFDRAWAKVAPVEGRNLPGRKS